MAQTDTTVGADSSVDVGSDPQAGQPDQGTQAEAQTASDVKQWAARIERCKRVRRNLARGWSDNVDYRRGKPFSDNEDFDRVNVNLDWSYSKAKHAQLFSQMPKVYLTPKAPMFEPAVPVFQRQVNDTLDKANTGDAIDECVWDAINASGVGVALVGYEALTEMKQVPTQDISQLPPEMQQAVMSGKVPNMLTQVPSVVSDRYYVQRISPTEFLWPVEFTGSNFDQADWLGRTGRMTWEAAMRSFGLETKDKQNYLSELKYDDNLRRTLDDQVNTEQMVEFDEVFYWAHRFDAEEKQFKRIRRIVFLRGKKEPIAHEDWKGQQFVNGKYIGSCKFPIRVLTLTYISDDAIPPSDTAIGRPQIEEMIKSRTQIVLNRDRSQPLRWADVNRVDPMIIDSINRGEFQSILPIQGDGSRAIGEVARAAYPNEDFAFDRVIKDDLQEQWQIGPNQMGLMSQGRRTAAEANYAQSNTNSKIGYERGKVGAFFCGVAEVMAGLVALYGDQQSLPLFNPDDQQRMQSWDRKQIGNEFAYWIRPDSTVLLDSEQRVDRLMRVLNMTGKSGFVNPKPIISELVELHGLDPANVVVDPQPQAPPPPNISYRFTGVQDLTNPVVVALLIKAGQAPSPQELQAAKMLLEAVDMPIQPPQSQQPGGPQGPQPGPDQGGMPPQGPSDARPEWGAMPQIIKRRAGE